LLLLLLSWILQQLLLLLRLLLAVLHDFVALQEVVCDHVQNRALEGGLRAKALHM